MVLKVYGPYARPDGRKHVVLYDTDTKKKTTQSYPRYAMEQKLGRKLLPTEHVDHIDGDCTNNNIDNFQLLTQVSNNQKAVKESGRSSKYRWVLCPVCGEEFGVLERRYQSNQVKQNKAGPYCSRSCAGRSRS